MTTATILTLTLFVEIFLILAHATRQRARDKQARIARKRAALQRALDLERETRAHVARCIGRDVPYQRVNIGRVL